MMMVGSVLGRGQGNVLDVRAVDISKALQCVQDQERRKRDVNLGNASSNIQNVCIRYQSVHVMNVKKKTVASAKIVLQSQNLAVKETIEGSMY